MAADEKRGIYRKFKIERTDGSSGPGGKHEHCAYFVLDLEHDEFALPALKAYAKACRKTHPTLAADIDAIIETQPVRCSCREAMCHHTPTFGPTTPSEMAGYLMERAEDDDGR